MDSLDIRLLRELEHGLPLIPEPFEEIGNRLGLTGLEVQERIRNLKSSGIVRKFTARVNQRLAGISANALVAWRPADPSHRDIGPLLAGFPCVTHCYERRPVPGQWEFSFYTVHHGRNRDAVHAEVKAIADQIGVSDYIVLFSTEEFKRVPNVRISEDGGDL
ncbi:MAG: AsnC family transcriptional regulator [Methanoregula sp.]|uniref:siroheme decarboxylase subunit beta n=2 Tax=Methanoregula sp. TaxID=2052170 RepID=UPI003BB04EAF